MFRSMRFAFLVGGFVFATQPSASTGLTLVRGNIGVTGMPRPLSGNLDVNHNGRREFLVDGAGRVSIVEEDASPRRYREVARVNAPGSLGSFGDALLVNIPGAEPALLLEWSQRLELRDASTLRVKAFIDGAFGNLALGDVDGDGTPEIVTRQGESVVLFDPVTLASRGGLVLPVGELAVADIVGYARAEIVSDDGRAYTLTRSGDALSSTEVWNAGVTGTWIPYVVDYEGSAAVVLHDAFGFSAKLATFRPAPSLRTVVPAEGPSFRPAFADANGDGRVDLITADGRNVRAIDLASGAVLWERDTIYQAPYIGSFQAPITVDLDGDGTIELIGVDQGSPGGLIAISAPAAGAPRWRAEATQSSVANWTTVRRADGSSSIAYLSDAPRTAPRLGAIGFLDGVTFGDQGGSSPAWLPGYDGTGARMMQTSIAALPQDGGADAVVVAGDELLSDNTPWLWTFDGNGVLLSARRSTAGVFTQRIATARVLDRPERQIVVAGWLPRGTSGTTSQTARVEVVDYASGNSLWQSTLLPSYDGAPLTRLDVADLDADGRLEVVVAYGQDVTILTPAAGTGVVANHVASTFSLLDRGIGRTAKLATLNTTDVAVYDGLAATPERTFVLPGSALAIALFAQAPDDTLMFATSSYGELAVRRYPDGEVVASNHDGGLPLLDATDIDADHRVEIIGSGHGFAVWRLDNDYIFRAGFD